MRYLSYIRILTVKFNVFKATTLHYEKKRLVLNMNKKANKNDDTNHVTQACDVLSLAHVHKVLNKAIA